jgi:hypothetical protein
MIDEGIEDKIEQAIRWGYSETEGTTYDVYVFADGGRTNLMTGGYGGEHCSCDGGCPHCTIVAKITGWSIYDDGDVQSENPDGETKEGYAWVVSQKMWEEEKEVKETLIDIYLSEGDEIANAITKANKI